MRLSIRFTAFAAMLLLTTANAAQAASFDCSKARTGVEKAICADPQASEYDERIAAAFKRGLHEWDGAIRDYVLNDQRDWLAQLRAIDKPDSEVEPLCDPGDVPCLRRELRIRTDTLESSAYRNSGVYKRDGGKLLVRAIRNADVQLTLFDRASGRLLRTAGDEAATQRSGLPQVQADTFQWDGPDTLILEAADDIGRAPDDGCKLTVLFAALKASVTQQGGCNGTQLAGIYTRAVDEQLADYENSID